MSAAISAIPPLPVQSNLMPLRREKNSLPRNALSRLKGPVIRPNLCRELLDIFPKKLR